MSGISTLERLSGRWPVMTTAGAGLEALLSGMGTRELGTGFGCRIAEESLYPATVLDGTVSAGNPEGYDLWNGAGEKVIAQAADPQLIVLRGIKISGRLELNNAYVGIVRLVDCIIDVSEVTDTVNNLADYCVKNYNTSSQIILEHCEVRGAPNYLMNWWKGGATNCYFHSSGGDGLHPEGDGWKWLIGCLIRRLGVDAQGHPDCLQFTTSCSNFYSANNVYYMPSQVSAWSESHVNAQCNNCFRCNASASAIVQGIMSRNDIFIGGSAAMAFNAKTSGIVRGIIVLSPRITKLASGYSRYNEVFPNANAGSTTESLWWHDARYIEDDTEIVHEPSATGIGGLWEWNATDCPLWIKNELKARSVVDASYAPLVTNRTGWLNAA